MKNIYRIFTLSIFFLAMLCISAYGAEVPEEIKNKGSQYYMQSHVFDCDNDFVLYFDGATLHAGFEFADTKEYQLSVRSLETYQWVYTAGIINEASPDIEADFSSFPYGPYLIRVAFTSSGNVYTDGYQIVDIEATKLTNGTCIFDIDSNCKSFEFQLDVYECIPEEDFGYYTEYLVPSPGSEQYELIKPVVDAVTEGLTTDYDKARAIYTWVADNIYYDMPAFREGYNKDAADPVMVMKTKRAVCAGYSQVLSIMFHMAGMPCIYTTGDCSGIGHAWNLACIDGVWCFIDSTWGSGNVYDNDTFTKGNVNYQYFATTAQFISASRTLDRGFSNICINGVEYSILYYPTLGKYQALVRDYFPRATDTVYIRDYIATVPVTDIDENCFTSGDNIKNIYIPETIKLINNSFFNVDNLNMYILGKDTNLYYIDPSCDNLTVYMPFSSKHFKGEDAYRYKVVNTDFELKSLSIDGNTLTVTVHNGLLKPQPVLALAIYDNNGVLRKMQSRLTKKDTETYTFDITGYGAEYTAKALMLGNFTTISPYTTALEQRLSQVIDSMVTLESFHKYLPEDDETQIYTYEGECHSIDVTFNDQTFTAENDYIYIYDGMDNLIGTYTGDALSGKTVNVLGNTVKIRLVTDEKGAAYGYKTTSIIVIK